MGQAECPEPQVGGSVGDAAEAVLDGVDGLRHQDLPEVKLRDNRAHETPCHKPAHSESLAGLWAEHAGSYSRSEV